MFYAGLVTCNNFVRIELFNTKVKETCGFLIVSELEVGCFSGIGLNLDHLVACEVVSQITI